MKALLMQKKVWSIVSGLDVKPPSDASHYRDWIKDQQSAAGIIFLGLEDDQKHQIQDVLDDPKAMWTKLVLNTPFEVYLDIAKSEFVIIW